MLFYDDELKVAIMRSHPAEDPAVFMPVCPPCDFLGVAWTAQRLRRYRRECYRALSAAFGATPTLAEALMEAMVNATLAGHDLEPISPAGDEHTSGYVAACWLCGRTVWVEKSGLLYSLLAEQCPFAIIGKQAS